MVLSPLSLSASMIRLNPSVCSRSASALLASMLCTIADIPILPDRFLMPTNSSSSGRVRLKQRVLKQFLAVRLDIGGKAEGVVACALLRQFGVALLEGFNDGEVLGQRSGGAVGASDRQLSVAADVKQDIVGHVDQHRRLGKRDQRLVKGDVGLGIFLDMGLRQ